MGLDVNRFRKQQPGKIYRKGWLADISTKMLLSLNFYYDIKYYQTDYLTPLKTEGFVLLPKHSRPLDITMEGLLLKKSIRRYGNYIMKGSLHPWLKFLGGVPIARLKDLKKLGDEFSDKNTRKLALQQAKQLRDSVRNKIAYLLDNDEIIVFHFEGTSSYGIDSKIVSSRLQTFLDIQKHLGRMLTFVPLDISYGSMYCFRSKVQLKVGQPIQVPDNGLDQLVQHLAKEIRLVHK